MGNPTRSVLPPDHSRSFVAFANPNILRISTRFARWADHARDKNEREWSGFRALRSVVPLFTFTQGCGGPYPGLGDSRTSRFRPFGAYEHGAKATSLS
mgnify:CR=1 FL=1